MNILDQYDDIAIKKALQNDVGPLLINAGPGSGKTRFLTTRVAYLLINKIVNINEIIVCTFTEKAANNLRNKITDLLLKYSPESFKEIKFEKLKIGTIHSVFLNLLEENIHYTDLSSGYTVLNELDRKLFVFNNLSKFNFNSFQIPIEKNKFKTFYEFETTAIFNDHIESWDLTDYLCKFYDSIVDQGAEVLGLDNLLKKVKNEDYIKLIESYVIYKRLLQENNYLDFTQIQNKYWELLNNDAARLKIRGEIKHLLVDEYQDTNFIQEVCLLESIGEFGGITNVAKGDKYPTKNITVVGDFNQSLYRFRGANIDNILTFQDKFVGPIDTLKLFKNYRSTQNIISLSNNFIDKNLKYYEKKMKMKASDFYSELAETKENYPIITFKSKGNSNIDFIKNIKSLIDEMSKDNLIKNLSDVAVLLPSIKYTEAKAFQEVFGDLIKISEEYDFFSSDIVIKLLISFAQIFEINSVYESKNSEDFKEIFDTLIKGEKILTNGEVEEVKGKLNKINPVELLYFILNLKSIHGLINEDNLIHIGRLSFVLNKSFKFSRKLNFELFFDEFLPFITNNTDDFFNNDLPEINEKIKLLTIHQSKGIEFPIVIVGFNKVIRKTGKPPLYNDPRDYLLKILKRKEIEDTSVVEEMQLRRLFYVAFSRAKELLIVGSRNNKISEITDFSNNVEIAYGKPVNELIPEKFEYKRDTNENSKLKLSYTGDILTYTQCPYMYALLNEFEFQVIENNDFVFGKFVHQTIENINKVIIENKYNYNLNELLELSEEIFELNFSKTMNNEKFLDQKTLALFQVKNYIYEFCHLLNSENLFSSEESFTWEKDEFILQGKIDVIFKTNEHYLLVDVKTGKKKNRAFEEIENFENQIKLYGNYFNEKYKISPKLMIYSTGEQVFKDGEYDVECADYKPVTKRVMEIINRIIKRDYTMDYEKLNLENVCPSCSFNKFCTKKPI